VSDGGRVAASEQLLPEIAEAEAEGTVAELYADIRDVLGLPVVNLVYRTLATDPARLDAIWTALRPNLLSRGAEDAARRLVERATPAGLAPVAATELSAAGIDESQIARARATLNAYARGNSHNLLAMNALLGGCQGTGELGRAAERPAPQPILPMVALDRLPPEELDALLKMSVRLLGDQRPILVPSLLRHLASVPALLERPWAAIEPALASLAETRDAVGSEARLLAGRLPYAVAPLEAPDERRLARRFATAMSTLLVVGEALRAALAEAS
jgi:halocarboxylic acid dehydrogenase DehI